MHNELGGGASRSVVNRDIHNKNSAQGRVLKWKRRRMPRKKNLLKE